MTPAKRWPDADRPTHDEWGLPYKKRDTDKQYAALWQRRGASESEIAKIIHLRKNERAQFWEYLEHLLDKYVRKAS